MQASGVLIIGVGAATKLMHNYTKVMQAQGGGITTRVRASSLLSGRQPERCRGTTRT